MIHHTDEPTDSPPLSDSNDQGDAPVIYQSFLDLECRIASRIVAWVNAPDTLPYYRDYILLLTPDALYSKGMDDLAFGCWRHMDASTWLSWHDVPGSFSSVWRAGMLRASTLLSSAS